MSISKYEFEMLSTPSCINFYKEDYKDGDKLGTPIRNWSKILFKDSLFDFFPYSEIYFKDSAGQIVDSVYFVEGLEFHCKLGFQEEIVKDKDDNDKKIGGYLEHDYIWSAFEINNITFAQSISGDNMFMMVSKHFYNDYPQSRTFNHESSTTKQTISNILINTILPAWGIDKSKFRGGEKGKEINSITDTTGTPYLNQNNISNKLFVSKLAEYAYSQNNKASGFYTFINCNGEFYFMTIQGMLNQPPVRKYKIDLHQDMMTDEYYIKDYRVLNGGVPVNFENYKRKIYRYKADGTNIAETKNIQTYANESELDTATQLLIRKQYIPTVNSKVTYGGIQEEENGLEFYQGFVNYFYRDTLLCYRMVIVVDFYAGLVSGKTIEIEVEKQTKTNEIAGEFSGKWLICESIHIMDKNGIPYSQLTISKPQIKIDQSHPFKKDFTP